MLEQLLAGYGRVLSPLPKVVSWVIGVGGISMLIGWTRAYAYLGAYGATWIMGNHSFSDYLSASLLPGLLLVAGLLITFADVTDGFVGRLGIIDRVVTVFYFVSFAGWLVLRLLGRIAWAADLITATLFGATLLLGLALGRIVASGSTTWTLPQMKLLFWSCIGVVMSVSLLGSTEAARDLIPEESRLPYVDSLKQPRQTVGRLLHSDGATLYVLRPGESPAIQMIVATDSIVIRPSDNRRLPDTEATAEEPS
jgi:hypothetical protein